MNRPSAPVTGVAIPLGAALVAVSVLSGLASLRAVVRPGPWFAAGVALVLLVTVVTALVRRTARSPYGPTLWGLVTGLVALAAVYGGVGSGPSLPMPTPDTLDRLVRLAGSGVTAIAEGTVPLEPVRGAELLVVAGAVAVTLVADLLALGLGRAALSGLALAALWSPVALFELRAPVAAVLTGGIAYLLLLVMTRPVPSQAARGRDRDLRPAVVAAAGVAVVSLVVGPLLAATPVFGSVRLPGGWGTGPAIGPVHLSDDLDMRASLGDRTDRPILTYTTTLAELGPLRMFTMVGFDGRQWQRGDVGGAVVEAQGVLWPTDVGAPVEEETGVVEIRVGELDEDRLPIPIEPRTVEIDGSWRYDSGRDEVLAEGSGTRGATYRVTVQPRDLSPDALRQDAPAPVQPDSPYLAVPESEFAGDVAALAAEVTAGAPTTYDQAIALQTYFRSAAQFTYDTEVPAARTEDAVWDFLTHRTGYCVQFATAMTVMARTLGIPARMAVGFLPGELTTQGPTAYVVTGRRAHTWPELYFQGAGWVRFEPTPSTQTGAPPSYADPFANTAAPQEEQIPGATAVPTTTPAPVVPAPQSGAVAGGQVRIGGTDVPVPAILSGIVLVLAGVGGLVWFLGGRRRSVPVPQGPEEWWAALRERLESQGVTWSDAATPRQAADVIRDSYPAVDDEGVTAAARRGLSRLVAAVENARYSPAPRSWDAGDLEAWVEATARPLEAAAAPPEPVAASR